MERKENGGENSGALRGKYVVAKVLMVTKHFGSDGEFLSFTFLGRGNKPRNLSTERGTQSSPCNFSLVLFNPQVGHWRTIDGWSGDAELDSYLSHSDLSARM